MSDFNDRPLVVGSVFGLRSFGVDKLGRLTGVTHRRVWTPGENVAQCSGDCSVTHASYMSSLINRHYTALLQDVTPPNLLTEVTSKGLGVEGVVEKVEPPKHRVAGVGNQCGYWAYFDGSNDYHDARETVTAIVEGYGTVTIGTRGFRAEKAKIVALVMPSHEERARSRIVSAWRRYALWADGRADLALPLALMSVIGGLSGTVASFAAGPMWPAILTIPLLLVGAVTIPATFKGMDYNLEARRAEPSFDAKLVRRNYPDVPVFATTKDALKAFPVQHPEPPEAISPETHPDFWTRSAS